MSLSVRSKLSSWESLSSDENRERSSSAPFMGKRGRKSFPTEAGDLQGRAVSSNQLSQPSCYKEAVKSCQKKAGIICHSQAGISWHNQAVISCHNQAVTRKLSKASWYHLSQPSCRRSFLWYKDYCRVSAILNAVISTGVLR